jgi:hypothetical protein
VCACVCVCVWGGDVWGCACVCVRVCARALTRTHTRAAMELRFMPPACHLKHCLNLSVAAAATVSEHRHPPCSWRRKVCASHGNIPCAAHASQRHACCQLLLHLSRGAGAQLHDACTHTACVCNNICVYTRARRDTHTYTHCSYSCTLTAELGPNCKRPARILCCVLETHTHIHTTHTYTHRDTHTETHTYTHNTHKEGQHTALTPPPPFLQRA